MKKTFLIAGLSTALLLSACGKEEVKRPEPTNTVQTTENKVVNVTQSELTKLTVSQDVSINDGKVSVDVNLENKNNKELPVTFEKDKAIEVFLLDGNGKEVDSFVTGENDRKSIKAKETLNWNADLSLEGKDNGDYTVNVVLHLLNADGSEINSVNAVSKTVTYGEKMTYDYTPRKPETLIYQNNNEEGKGDMTEEFMYFENGYAQAYNSSIGGNTIYYTDKTGYYRVYTEVGTRKTNLIKDIEPKKEMLLKLPVVKGQSWDDGNGIMQTVVDDNATLDTAVGTLKNVVVVEATIGQKVRFYYQKDYGLVQMDVAGEDGKFVPNVVLKDVK